MIIDGKEMAKKILKELKTRIEKFKKPPCLAAILIGKNQSLKKFIDLKQKAAKDIGVEFKVYKFSETVSNNYLRKEINKIVKIKSIDGVIIELPLPKHLNTQYLLNTIPEEKDIDCLSQKSQGAFFVGKSKILPPSVETVKTIFEEINFDLKGRLGVIFGYGVLVGKPISHWLSQNGATVMIINEFTQNPEKLSKEADFLISGVGKPSLINSDMVKNKAIVIDFGFNFLPDNQKPVGDVDFESVSKKTSFITPVPGGVGPILVACLLKNLIKLAELTKI